MEDFKIILYILAAAAYFVITQWRKAFKSPDPEQQERPQQQQKQMPRQPGQPVTSFEDILRELQPKAEKARAEGKAVVQEAREFVGEKVLPPLAPTTEPASPRYKSYEDTPVRVLSWEKQAEAIEAAKQSKFREKGNFESYEKEKPVVANRYAAMLRKPNSAREAVILTEIFNRKYN